MGGLDDLVDDQSLFEDNVEETKVEEIKDELGVENLDDLEEAQDKLKQLTSIVMLMDKRFEEMEREIERLRSSVQLNRKAILKEADDEDDNKEEESKTGTDWGDIGSEE